MLKSRIYIKAYIAFLSVEWNINWAILIEAKTAHAAALFCHKYWLVHKVEAPRPLAPIFALLYTLIFHTAL